MQQYFLPTVELKSLYLSVEVGLKVHLILDSSGLL